jgi:uncharacterized membrane protein YgcG
MNKRILLTSLTAGMAAMGISFFIAAGAVSASAPAVAPAQATAIPLNPAMTSPLTSTRYFTAPRVAIAISNYFTVPVTQVVTLHTDGWGYGEIFKLYQLSLVSGRTVTEVKSLRDSGMGWGNIAKQLNVRPGNAGVNLGAALSDRQVLAQTAQGPATTSSNTTPQATEQPKPPKKKDNPGQGNNGNNQNNPSQGNNQGGGQGGGGQQSGGQGGSNNNGNNGNNGNQKPDKPKKDK